ncbi:MAG: ABC transporter permease subunit [Spirochaetaceae bacterium]|jgi:L-cystine transport system permease protein|nr:ABC transporter permease subunit [Spirochaetaceae bacterium]
MNFDFFFMLEALLGAVERIPTTLYIATVSVILGLVFGMFTALLRFYEVKVIASLLKWMITLIKGIPIILLLLVFYIIMVTTYNDFMASLGLKYVFRDFNTAYIAIAALSIMSSTGMSEAFRGSLAAIDRSQFDAAYAMGLTKRQTLLRIILPQVVPVSIPIVGNLYIGMLKGAALASTVSVVDILNGAILKAGVNYRYFEAYVAAGLVFWGLSIIIEKIFYTIERQSNSILRKSAN